MIRLRHTLAEGSMQFLHLTDLHYSKNSPFQIELIKRLVEDLKKLIASGVAPDLVIFSGDLVNDPDEPNIYEEFEEKFLAPVLGAISLRPNDIIFCPGNHDVSRKEITEWSDERKRLAITQKSRPRKNFFDPNCRVCICPAHLN
jgi:predicted MPP superfamily phosphohydrolase